MPLPLTPPGESPRGRDQSNGLAGRPQPSPRPSEEFELPADLFDDDEGVITPTRQPDPEPPPRRPQQRVVKPEPEPDYEEDYTDEIEESEDPFEDISDSRTGSSVFDEFEDDEENEEENEEEGFLPPKRPTRKKPQRPSRKLVDELEEDNNEDEEIIEEKPKKLSRREARKQNKNNSVKKEIQPVVTDDTFIDKDKIKLKPYGRKNPKKSRDGEFDDRTNLRQRAARIRYGTLGLLSLLVLLGIKNAIIPPATLSQKDVQAIVATQVGDTGFPLDKGEAFANDFMRAYLNINSDPYSQRILNYYYSGNFDQVGNEASTLTPSANYKQSVISGPNVYSKKAVSPSSALYTIGAIVSNSGVNKDSSNKKSSDSKNSNGTTDGTEAKWAYYAVAVYYDKASDSFRIAPKSPIIVPALDVTPGSAVPKAAPIGTGKIDPVLTETVTPTVVGYIKAFAESSTSNHSALDPYITDPSKISLTKGLDKRYTLSGADSEAVKVEAYPTEKPGEIKAVTTVNWLDGNDATGKAVITSSYVITLLKQSNEKYLVDTIVPEYFIPIMEVQPEKK